MARVGSKDVQEIIWDIDTTLSLTAFIQQANLITNRLAALDTNSELDSDTLFEIERLLAAHFSCHKDPRVTQSNSLSSGAAYEAISYLDTAMMLDSTGNLKKILSGKNVKVGMRWLGKAPSNQIDYVDRD